MLGGGAVEGGMPVWRYVSNRFLTLVGNILLGTKVFFFASGSRHTRWNCDWSSDVCSSDLATASCATAPTACSCRARAPTCSSTRTTSTTTASSATSTSTTATPRPTASSSSTTTTGRSRPDRKSVV